MTGDRGAVGGQPDACCRQALPAAAAEPRDEYGYARRLLCVIDAVCAIGVSYQSSRATVERMWAQLGITRMNRVRPAPRELQWMRSRSDSHGSEAG